MNVDIGTVRNSCNFGGEMSNVFSSCKTAWIFFLILLSCMLARPCMKSFFRSNYSMTMSNYSEDDFFSIRFLLKFCFVGNRNFYWKKYFFPRSTDPYFTSSLPVNPFVPNALFLYALKISENLTLFWCLEKGCIGKGRQRVRKGALGEGALRKGALGKVEKGCIGSEWIKLQIDLVIEFVTTFLWRI